ncbi:MAG: DUF4843 domain-containing protein [Pseudobacter sp.]|uniref:DUF4843 domain-containing protein n=1 Tax=Pseudobacter sp. TaxID=2045420 RepID=UPI003F7F281B
MKQFIPGILGLLLLGACSKENVQLFNSKGDIYFNNLIKSEDYESWDKYFDTLKYSFATKEPAFVQDTLVVSVKITGNTTSTPRAFQLITDEEHTDAIEGRDFKLPENNNYFIPGGAVTADFKVVIFKTSAMEEKPLYLTLRLLPNENFDTLFLLRKENVLDRSAPAIRLNRFVISMSNTLNVPAYWSENENFFGKYSWEKWLIVARVLDIEPDYDLSGFPRESYKRYATSTQQYLNSEAAKGNIIRERDGSVMIMGPDVQ